MKRDSFLRPSYSVPEPWAAGEKSEPLGVPGLGVCAVCRSIATYRCVECSVILCDTECLYAHKLDHPKIQPAIVFRLCKWCQRSNPRPPPFDYCSDKCHALADVELRRRRRNAKGRAA